LSIEQFRNAQSSIVLLSILHSVVGFMASRPQEPWN